MKTKNNETIYLDIQIFTSLIVITTVITSILLTYNEKLNQQKKKTIFDKKQSQNISFINRFTILLTSIIFLYINYKLFQISKDEGEDLKVYYLQIIASILSVIASIIVFYVVIKETEINSVSDVENPII